MPGADDLDFRDIEAFDARTVYVLSAGPGAASRIYKSEDGGSAWTLQFINEDPAAFYNAIAFWNERRGLAFGDPIAGRYTVLRTDDGLNWRAIGSDAMPEALPGEAAFAASGGCIATAHASNAWFATGGAERARVFTTNDRGNTWIASDTPLVAGRASAGVFALAFRGVSQGIAVGGDYLNPAESNANLARTLDGKTWSSVGATRLPGFRSSVAFLPDDEGLALIAVGPTGSDLSFDGGRTWNSLNAHQLHAVAATSDKDTYVAFAVGENGRVRKLSFPRHETPAALPARVHKHVSF